MVTSYLEDFGDDVFEELTSKGVKGGQNDHIPSLDEHYHFKPVFGLDYLSLDSSPFCFNNPSIPAYGLIEVLKCCQRMSLLTYQELEDTSIGNAYHFHEVDQKKLEAHGLIDKFQEKLPDRKKRLPPVYQVAIYTDGGKGDAPRMVGYIGKWGIFYLLWLDWGHQLYRDNYQSVLPSAKPPQALPSANGIRSDGKPKRPRIPTKKP